MENTTAFMQDLRAFAGKLAAARFYISLKGKDISSGFYAESQTRVGAKQEAANH